MKKLILLIALLCGAQAFAASPTLFNKVSLSGKMHIKPQAMPSSLTAVTSSDTYIYMLVVVATSAQTVLVEDNQGTPVPLYPTFTSVAGTVYVATFPDGYWCPGGFSVQAGGTGVNYYASFAL